MGLDFLRRGDWKLTIHTSLLYQFARSEEAPSRLFICSWTALTNPWSSSLSWFTSLHVAITRLERRSCGDGWTSIQPFANKRRKWYRIPISEWGRPVNRAFSVSSSFSICAKPILNKRSNGINELSRGKSSALIVLTCSATLSAVCPIVFSTSL